MPLRLVFMGSPEFAVPTLTKIVERGHKVVAAYTQPPKPAGRGMEVQPTAVEREARRFGIPVHTPKTLRDAEAQDTFRAHQADAAVVVAYGLILPTPVLDAPRFGCFNLHASALPRWRGAAPIQRAIMAGDTETAVMVMKMEEGLDTGPTAMAKRISIPGNMTAGELHDRLARCGAELMVRALRTLERGAMRLTSQEPTYAPKIDKSETRIDWSKSWRAVHDHCRGLSPFPGAWSELSGVGRIKVLQTIRYRGKRRGAPGTVLDDRLTIACGDGAIRIVELQRVGGKPMKAEEFLRGSAIPPGTRLA
jgi:methionyl-tRNA formyltransferase